MLSPLAVETESATGAPDRPELEVSQEVEEREREGIEEEETLGGDSEEGTMEEWEEAGSG
jgi:hypothetical protein